MKRSILVLGLIVLSTMLAGCGCCSPTATPITPANTPTTFILETSGTIAGIRQLLTISEGKSVVFKDNDSSEKTSTVSEQQYADMVAQVARADFFNLNGSYDSSTVADDRYYALTVTQGSKSKTINIAEIGGKDLTPAALSDLITMLVNVQKGLTATNN